MENKGYIYNEKKIINITISTFKGDRNASK